MTTVSSTEKLFESDEDPEYLVGWDPEQEAAWRWRQNEALVSKEYTSKLIFPPNADDQDSVIAEWADGFKAEIVAVTVFQLKEKKKRAQAAADKMEMQKVFWSNSDNTVQVKVKKDHTYRLVYIAEKESGQKRKQICQSFGVELYKSETDAIRIMTTIAQAYCDGSCSKEQLYSRRNEMSAAFLTAQVSSKASKVKDARKQKQVARLSDDDRSNDESAIVLRRPAHSVSLPPAPPSPELAVVQSVEEMHTPPPRAKRRNASHFDFSFAEDAILGMDDFTT